MRPYLAILSAVFRSLLQYRLSAYSGAFTQIFWGVIRSMILTAFYSSSSARQPIDLAQTISYVWLSQAVFALVVWAPDPEVQSLVRTGGLAYELARPVDLYWLWYSRALAARLAPTLLRAAAVLLVAALIFGLHAPASAAAGLAWLIATGGAFLLVSSLAALTSVTLLYTIAGDGMARIMPAVAYTLSGVLIPLPLLPYWALRLVNFLPFRDLADSSIRLYIGQAAPAALLPIMMHQALWTACFVIAGRALLLRALRKAVLQGG